MSAMCMFLVLILLNLRQKRVYKQLSQIKAQLYAVWTDRTDLIAGCGLKGNGKWGLFLDLLYEK